jgi:hypothetical protein
MGLMLTIRDVAVDAGKTDNKNAERSHNAEQRGAKGHHGLRHPARDCAVSIAAQAFLATRN